MRFETTHEHVARDIREGTFPKRSEPKLVPGTEWYRGWEIQYDRDAAAWNMEPWEACKGGIDPDAPLCRAKTREDLITEIDESEVE